MRKTIFDYCLLTIFLACSAQGAQALSTNPAGIAVIICDGMGHPLQNQAVELTIEVEKTKNSQTILYQGMPLTVPIPAEAAFVSIYARAPGYKSVTLHHLRPETSNKNNNSGSDQVIYLMLVPQHAALDMEQAHWQDLAAKDPQLLSRLLCGQGSPTGCQASYEQLLRQHPDRLACLLNIAVALQQIHIGGRSAFSYFQAIGLGHNLFRDRFFAYVDRSLLDQLEDDTKPAHRKTDSDDTSFTRLRMFRVLHRHATSSFKEIDLDRANVQLTFDEDDSLVINGILCVRVETDIDYFRPFLAHGFKEVLPNIVFHRRSSPLRVFQLRWLATRKKQLNGGDISDFAPSIGLSSKH
jgi:hypothetical protein